MKKIFLMGQRANRTPLSYPEYRKLFQKRLEYAQKPEDADFLVFSCLMDLRDNADQVGRIFSLRPDIKLVILSEEPLWDTLWSGDFSSKNMNVDVGARAYPCVFLNHVTTRIYDFEEIPYFLTTSDDYFVRYSFLFARNRAFKGGELESLWVGAPVRTAFYAEYRDDAQYDVQYPRHDVWGLSRYRTLVARGIEGAGVVRVGKGWGSKVRRQTLPDWHLDKLAALDRRSFIVSGIDNTHQWNYISEKIFDAFAVLAVPLYFASRLHGVMRIVPQESFLNLHGLSAGQAVEKIRSFRPDKSFIDQYRAAQNKLSETFSQPISLLQERYRVVSEVVSEFEAL